MSEDFYEAIGRILNNSFSQNKDPFDVIKKDAINKEDGQDLHSARKRNVQSENAQNTHKVEKSQMMNGEHVPRGNSSKAEFQKMKIPKVVVPVHLIEDFLTLKLPPGSSLEECKASWKNLLKRYHPDLQDSNDSGNAEVIIRINNSFRRIEKWFTSYKG